jgi:hypothetical protein
MIERNPNEFLMSLNSELQSQASRVRNLIGNAHWLSDGEHKESIVRHLVERYIPDGFEVTSGFAIDVENPDLTSKQLDVVVVDCRFEPPLFRRDTFAVCFVSTLVSVISIKSKFTKKSFVDSLDNLISVASLQDSRREKASLLSLFFDDEISPLECYGIVIRWCGEDQHVRSKVEALRSHSVTFATTSGLLMRYRSKDFESGIVHAAFYDCPGLSSAYLIASCMMSASMHSRNASTDFSTFVTNAFSGNLLGEIRLDAPPNT